MRPAWKRMKGMGNVCSKCDGVFDDDEFEFDMDECTKCVFPEVGVTRPVMYNNKYGDKKNTTQEAELMSELEYIPEKQSKASKKAKRDFEWRNYPKK